MAEPRKMPERLLRETLRDPENLREFLTSALPDEVANLDFAHVEELPREYYSGDWREREADLIFEVGHKHGTAVVGVLIEHQSDTDPFVPLRALCNLANYWERKWRDWEKAPAPKPKAKVPATFSVVLYTSPDLVWGSNTNVRDLLGPPAALHPFAPDWGPVFWTLADRSPEALLAAGPWMQLMAVMRATAAEREEFARVFGDAMRHIASVSEAEHVRSSLLLRAVSSYATFRRPDEEWPAIREIARRENPRQAQEVEKMFESHADKMERLGIEKGKLHQARSLLEEMIQDRFGAVPDPIRQRIDASDDLDKLNKAARKVYAIQTLDELGL